MSKALQALPGEEREIELRPWLFRVAHNESISIMRERTRAERDPAAGRESRGNRAGGPASSAASGCGPWSATSTALPDRQRGALVMRELSGLSYAEIARTLAAARAPRGRPSTRRAIALQTREEGRADGV